MSNTQQLKWGAGISLKKGSEKLATSGIFKLLTDPIVSGILKGLALLPSNPVAMMSRTAGVVIGAPTFSMVVLEETPIAHDRR